MKFDDVLKIIGEFGRYQQIKFAMICVVAIISAFLALNMVFVGGKPGYHCKIKKETMDFYTNSIEGHPNMTREEVIDMMIPNDAEGTRESCLIYANASLKYTENGTSAGAVTADRAAESCSEWEYDNSVYGHTIVNEWDLVCEKSALRDTAKSIFFAGRLVGAVSFGFLSDVFGRRPVFLVALVLQVIIGIVASFSPNLIFFYVAYFVQGVMQVGVFLTIFVMGTELVGPSYRKLTGFLVQSAYSVGYMLLPLIAYFVRNWRYLELAISIPAILFVSYYWFVPESVRWLLTHGKYDEAKEIIRRAARKNGASMDESILQKLEESSTKTAEESTVVNRSCLYLLSTPAMAFISFNLWINWVINSLVYYGLALNSENIGGSVYINLFLQGAVEIPAYILCVALLDRTGRRPLMCALMLFGGITSGVVAFIPRDMTWLAVTLASLGKFGITASYGIVYLFAAECFPTSVRNIGMGVASMSSRVGGILSPYVLLLGELFPQAPMLLMGGLSIFGGLLCLTLPETLGRPMPETVEEITTLMTKTNLFRRRGRRAQHADAINNVEVPLNDAKTADGAV